MKKQADGAGRLSVPAASSFPYRRILRRIGTQVSAVSRIEDADYDRHSVQTLSKVAEALGMRLIIDMKPNATGVRRTKLA